MDVLNSAVGLWWEIRLGKKLVMYLAIIPFVNKMINYLDKILQWNFE